LHEDTQAPPPRPSFYLRSIRRGVFIIPSLFTSATLFSGFYAIVSAFEGDFIKATLALLLAVVFDAMDGRIARLVHAETAFGAHFDSLSDMVAFGVAPAVIIFNLGLSSLGKPGWFGAFIYMACAALRLARFNVQKETSVFIGLASPAAATVVASTVWILHDQDLVSALSWKLGVLLMIVAILTGLLMVSNIRYWSPKYWQIKNRIAFTRLVAIIILFALIAAYPPVMLFALSIVYALSGPIWSLWTQLRH